VRESRPLGSVGGGALKWASLPRWRAGTDQVAIGFTGITWDKRCIVLDVGDTWIAEQAANLAWAAICDTAKTASVTVQQVIS